MSFLLLGVDSLIACLALGPIVSRRARLPFAAAFGVCDGLGFLLGSAFHWQMPDGVANVVATTVLVALGVYWIALAATSGRVAGTRWMWVLPVVLSIDNITFGLIDGHWTTSVAGQAAEQALSSALLALIGLLVSQAVVRLVPALQRSRVASLGFAGGALVLAAGVELLIG
jgi:putative Mn2+ efflux pump MntP